jgi:hypothetical protein
VNDPRPLLLEDATELEAALLREAATVQPTPEALNRTLQALGVAGTVLAVATATATTTATATGLKAGLSTMLLKWLSVLSITAALVGAGIHWRGLLFGSKGTAKTVTASENARPLAISGAAPGPEQQPDSSAVPSQAASDPSAIAAAEAPSLAGGSAEPAPPAPRASAAETSRSLAPEIALIDQTRVALKSAKPNVALALLDSYRRQFPNGRFAPEANYLRIEALAASGNRKAAEALAHKSLDKGADGPHDKRIRAILESGAAPPSP